MDVQPLKQCAHPVQVSALEHLELLKLRPHQQRQRMRWEVDDGDYPHAQVEADAFHALVDDIAEVGILEPLLVNMQRTILDGHARYRAALELGLPTVPVRVVWGLSSCEEFTLALGGPDPLRAGPYGVAGAVGDVATPGGR